MHTLEFESDFSSLFNWYNFRILAEQREHMLHITNVFFKFIVYYTVRLYYKARYYIHIEKHLFYSFQIQIISYGT